MSSLARVLAHSETIHTQTDTFLQKVAPELSTMLRYFMGFLEEDGSTGEGSGKRFRPAFMLFIASVLGVEEKTIPAAISVELFHNFSLIHDDVEDGDELRRGRPTVWKRWGINSAINAGDAQLILALQALEPLANPELTAFLLARYLEVIEGQQLDFALTEASLSSPEVTEEAYLEMCRKKSAVLVAASTGAPAFVAGLSERECLMYVKFGEELGLAYQLFDDYQSLWGPEIRTGKKKLGDLYEQKKIYPVLYARDMLSLEESNTLCELYASEMSDMAVQAVLALIDKSGAENALKEKIEKHLERSLATLTDTSLPQTAKDTLHEALKELTTY